MGLQELRTQMDAIDREIVKLYCRRMETARAIGRYKRENGIAVLDKERERELLDNVAAQAGAENAEGVRALYELLMAQSRKRQEEEDASRSE